MKCWVMSDEAAWMQCWGMSDEAAWMQCWGMSDEAAWMQCWGMSDEAPGCTTCPVPLAGRTGSGICMAPELYCLSCTACRAYGVRDVHGP